MENAISEAAALRVALASKMLPGIELQSLLGVLIQHLGEPLSEAKLSGLSPKSFRVIVNSLAEGLPRRDVTNALAVLTNPGTDGTDAPVVNPDQSSLGDNVVKVAITSNQGEVINGHYGSCLRILIYEVSTAAHQLVDVREIDTEATGEARTDSVLDLIRDCQILFTLSIGGPAAAKVTRASIHPIKKPGAMTADTVLTNLSEVLRVNPPPWLRKYLGLPRKTEYMMEG